jgi:hypothetical protein
MLFILNSKYIYGVISVFPTMNYVALAAVLAVIVGVLQFAALCGQIYIYRRQAKIMAHQAKEMTRQRLTMRGQLEAMRGQLGEMVAQTSQLKESVGVARESADAARKSADAAKASADALKGIERAWIIVTLEARGRTSDGGYTAIQIQGSELSMTAVTIVCQNEGRSPAWLIDVWARFDVVDAPPSEPALTAQDALDWSHSEPILVGKWAAYGWTATCQRRWDSGKVAVLYGIVSYRDVFGDRRSTSFGYEIAANGGFGRMTKYPNYNKHI